MLDLVNAAFVSCATLAAWRDLVRVRADRGVRGLSLATGVLFTVCPLWDLCYYASLGQSVSMVVCGVLVCIRGAWMLHAVRCGFKG